MKSYKFKVKGLDCPNCASRLEEELKKLDVICNVTVNFITQKLSFECEEEKLEEAVSKIKKVIKKEEPDMTIEEE